MQEKLVGIACSRLTEKLTYGPVMADYESETTRFLRDLMTKHPELAALQRRNRATWWDCKLDAEEQRRFQAADETKPGYAYFPVPKASKPAS